MDEYNVCGVASAASASGCDTSADSWILVHFPYPEVSNKFQILKLSSVKEGEDVLIGNTVTVRVGKGKLRAQIVHISESKEFLKEHYEKFKENFLKNTNDAKMRSFVTQVDQLSKAAKTSVLGNEYAANLNIMKRKLSKLIAPVVEEVPRPPVEVKQEVCEKNGEKFIKFGDNDLIIDYNLYNTINWSNLNSAIAAVVDNVYERNILTKEEPVTKLDSKSIKDITSLVRCKSNMTTDIVRNCINAKCNYEIDRYVQRYTNDKAAKRFGSG